MDLKVNEYVYLSTYDWAFSRIIKKQGALAVACDTVCS
jgi:hypothetical protein